MVKAKKIRSMEGDIAALGEIAMWCSVEVVSG